MGIELVSQRDMRGLPAAAVHDLRFRRTGLKGLSNSCHFWSLVRNALMRDVVLGEERLQVFLRGGGTDGFVKNGDSMAGLASKLKIHKRFVFRSRAEFQLETAEIQLCDADRT